MNTLLDDVKTALRVRFRFLYGRWIPRCQRKMERLLGCSDSSMVDEYVQQCLWNPNRRLVQIPLWSMNTRRKYWRIHVCRVQIPLWSMNTASFWYASLNCSSSDSSMVDEYIIVKINHSNRNKFRFLYGRWIPSMFTFAVDLGERSDSSMVDEYDFATVASTSIKSSDSSMVDEYPLISRQPTLLRMFRFLYGRWILSSSKYNIKCPYPSSDSSMVDEYTHNQLRSEVLE